MKACSVIVAKVEKMNSSGKRRRNVSSRVETRAYIGVYLCGMPWHVSKLSKSCDLRLGREQRAREHVHIRRKMHVVACEVCHCCPLRWSRGATSTCRQRRDPHLAAARRLSRAPCTPQERSGETIGAFDLLTTPIPAQAAAAPAKAAAPTAVAFLAPRASAAGGPSGSAKAAAEPCKRNDPSALRTHIALPCS